MHFHRIAYPAVPQDTFQAANSLYGKGNIYLRLGDHLDELLVGLIPPHMNACWMKNRTFETNLQCAMLTVFQFVEELANQPMIEAVRSRVDLKYALHLSMNSPSLDPEALCEIRQQLLSYPANRHIFQNLLDRLVEFGLIKHAQDKPVKAYQLLITVCTLNRFDEALKAMYRVLESVAVTDPEWLRQVTLPHWYERYNRGRRLSPISYSDEKWNARSLQIAADIQYLLGAIDRSQNSALASLQEIHEIRRILKEQFVTKSEESGHPRIVGCRPAKCAHCMMHPVVKEV